MDKNTAKEAQQSLEKVLSTHFKIDKIESTIDKDRVQFDIMVKSTEIKVTCIDGEVKGYVEGLFEWEVEIQPKNWQGTSQSPIIFGSDITLAIAIEKAMEKYKEYYVEFIEDDVNFYNSYFK